MQKGHFCRVLLAPEFALTICILDTARRRTRRNFVDVDCCRCLKLAHASSHRGDCKETQTAAADNTVYLLRLHDNIINSLLFGRRLAEDDDEISINVGTVCTGDNTITCSVLLGIDDTRTCTCT